MNILVGEGVDANVSLNLYDTDAIEAVNLIAESAGFPLTNNTIKSIIAVVKIPCKNVT